MTEDEVIKVINNIANRLAYRFKFGYHEVDDMKQQARLFACEGLNRYDGIRPLENFLWTHVHNRLFNFKRDKYVRPEKPCKICDNNQDNDICIKFSNDKLKCEFYSNWTHRNKNKKNIMNPIGITEIDINNEKNLKQYDNDDILNYKYMTDIIDKELPLNLRHLYLRLKFNTKISKIQKTKIQTAIKEILIKYGYE